MTERESMSGADVAWLRMDEPTNQMLICGVMSFDAPLPRERLKDLITERLLVFDRFHRRVVDRQGSPAWEDDPLFDVDAHLHRIALPAASSHTELEELVADLLATPLDPDKPLWQIHMVDRPSGTALIVRLHH